MQVPSSASVERALQNVPALLREAAARHVLPWYRRLGDEHIDTKSSPKDLVTIADRATETFLTPQLTALLPGSLVLGEEAAASDPAILAHLADPAPVWVLDPIDGTANFAAGRPPFAVMLALVIGNETVAAFVLDPLTDRLAQARPDGGTWVDGARLAMPAPGKGAPVSVSEMFWPADVQAAAEAAGGLHQFTRAQPLMCAGHEYWRLARGEIAAATYWRLLPWDHAAPALIAQEAGVRIAHPDGAPYRPHAPTRRALVAAHPDWWEDVRAACYPDLSLVP